MERFYTVSKKQDLELTVAEIISFLVQNSGLKLKKVGKTAKPFRYVLCQISYDYTVEVMNRLKGFDLVDRVTEELWTVVCNMLEAVIKIIPRKRNARRKVVF